jgi:hypothetical protein
MNEVDIAPARARIPPAVLAFGLLELALVAGGIAVLQRRAPWDAPRFAEFVALEVAAIVVALAFNFAVLPGRTRRRE